jgi:hypothetical protein
MALAASAGSDIVRAEALSPLGLNKGASDVTVTRLYPWTGSPEDLPVPLDRIGTAFRQLDGLWSCIERIMRDQCQSVPEWKAACGELLVRLPRVRQSLEDLAGIRANRWPDTDWAVRLSAARAEVERRLLDLSNSMSSFACGEASGPDTVASFSFDCAKLAKVVAELCGLIAKQHPEAIGET